MSRDWDEFIDETAWLTAEVNAPAEGQGFINTPMGPSPSSIWITNTNTVNTAYLNYIGALASNSPLAQIITNQMINSGWVSPGASAKELSDKYKQALIFTAQANSREGNNSTVFDSLQILGGGSPQTDGGGGGGGTYKDVIRYTDEQVRQKAVDAYVAVLGTQPTEEQIAEFARALRAGAAAAPSVQKVSAGGKMRETTQGFDERAFVAGFMANKVPDASGDLSGAAGGVQDLIENYRQNYGVNPTAGFVQDSIRRIISSADPNTARADLEAQLREQAEVLYPALRDKIQAGISVRAIADPYIKTLANLSEQADMSIGLGNKYINEALSFKNDKGEYQLMDRNEFARRYRSTNEWLDTRNAKETMLSAADGILKQFGFKR